jgi:ATP-binding cassette subfamily B protein
MKWSFGSLLKPYMAGVIALVVLALAQNALGLVIPKIVATGIDAYGKGTFVVSSTFVTFGIVAIGMFIFIFIQNITQVMIAERVVRGLRARIVEKISRQSFQFVQDETPARLLTNLTSDVDGIKGFVSQVIPQLVSSLFLIIGASVLLFTINWKLALAVLAIIPLIGITFGVVFSRVGGLFKKSQEVIDRLNRVINESILGSALIRVLHGQSIESEKFLDANTRAQTLGVAILKMFASMIPIIMLVSNAALLIVLLLGGHFVIAGSMTVGDLVAFNSYIAILVFPIMMLGFVGNMMARASASLVRIGQVLERPDVVPTGTRQVELSGSIQTEGVTVSYGDKKVLDRVSLTVAPGTKTAVIGPTAAGKTTLLYVLAGLITPHEGVVAYDSIPLTELDRASFHRQAGLVFQDSVMFNVSIRENVLFGAQGTDEDVWKALEVADIAEAIKALPEGLDTVVSERGTSLSGGQKQRIMLARALAMKPRILFLDDFTARVDVRTEQKILNNLAEQFPDITLVSVTQKVSTAASYDKVIVLMEGEVVAQGTHDELMHRSPEYVQIWNSQQSTNTYEVHA